MQRYWNHIDEEKAHDGSVNIDDDFNCNSRQGYSQAHKDHYGSEYDFFDRDSFGLRPGKNAEEPFPVGFNQ